MGSGQHQRTRREAKGKKITNFWSDSVKRDLQNLVEVLWWPLSRVVSTVNLTQPRITWKEGISAEGLPGSHDHLWGDDWPERTQPPLGGAISRLKELGCMQQLAECVSGQAVSNVPPGFLPQFLPQAGFLPDLTQERSWPESVGLKKAFLTSVTFAMVSITAIEGSGNNCPLIKHLSKLFLECCNVPLYTFHYRPLHVRLLC